MSTTETRWWWIRHAPVIGDEGRIYGQTDLHADCSDDALFAAVADYLPNDAVHISSDLNRTKQTAAAILKAGSPLPEPTLDPAMREQHFGDWQGEPRDEFAARRNRTFRQMWLSAAQERMPGGESFADVYARVTPAVERWNADHLGKDIVCVAHGGTIRTALALALSLDHTKPDLEKVFPFTIRNCSVTRIDHVCDPADGGAEKGIWRVGVVNWLPS